MATIGLARKLGQRNPRAITLDGDTAYVPLTKGLRAMIDHEDAHLVCSMRWSVTSHGYARAAYTRQDGTTETIFMHRILVGAAVGQYVDHIDGDKLNNRKTNLRLCQQYQNMANRGAPRNSSTGYKGVSLCRETGRYRAILNFRGKVYRLGRFQTAIEAAHAYDAMASRLLGQFARPNIAE